MWRERKEAGAFPGQYELAGLQRDIGRYGDTHAYLLCILCRMYEGKLNIKGYVFDRHRDCFSEARMDGIFAGGGTVEVSG